MELERKLNWINWSNVINEARYLENFNPLDDKIIMWFHAAYKDVTDSSEKITAAFRQLAVLEEEVNELNEALETLEVIDILDAFLDISWVCTGVMYLTNYFYNQNNDIPELSLIKDQGIDVSFIIEKNYKEQIFLTKELINRCLAEIKETLKKDRGLLSCPLSISIDGEEVYSDTILSEKIANLLKEIMVHCKIGLFAAIYNNDPNDEWFEPKMFLPLVNDNLVGRDILYFIIESHFNLAMKEIVDSNNSKMINGELIKDETGKITKQPAIEKGTYYKPDLAKFLNNLVSLQDNLNILKN